MRLVNAMYVCLLVAAFSIVCNAAVARRSVHEKHENSKIHASDTTSMASALGTAAQSSKAVYSYIRNGHGIKVQGDEVSKNRETSYAIVCFDAPSAATGNVPIQCVTPVYTEMCAKMVRCEVIDEGTWGFVFDIVKDAPFMVFDVFVAAPGNPGQNMSLSLKKPAMFWMPKMSGRK